MVDALEFGMDPQAHALLRQHTALTSIFDALHLRFCPTWSD